PERQPERHSPESAAQATSGESNSPEGALDIVTKRRNAPPPNENQLQYWFFNFCLYNLPLSSLGSVSIKSTERGHLICDIRARQYSISSAARDSDACA